MNGFLATLGRELRAYFFSPLAYLVLTFFLLANGISFVLIVNHLSDPRASGLAPFEFFFGGVFFWFVLIIASPLLTMRLLSEERRSGTIEILMTAPVSGAQVVLGKYLAAFGFYIFLWLPTLAYAVMIDRHSDVDWGPIAGGYLGTLGVGAMFMAIGIFGSSFTKNQLVAAISTFAMLMLLLVGGLFESLVTGESWKDILGYINLPEHMHEFSTGIVDTRRLVFYLTTSVLLLFLSSRALEAKKWR